MTRKKRRAPADVPPIREDWHPVCAAGYWMQLLAHDLAVVHRVATGQEVLRCSLPRAIGERSPPANSTIRFDASDVPPEHEPTLAALWERGICGCNVLDAVLADLSRYMQLPDAEAGKRVSRAHLLVRQARKLLWLPPSDSLLEPDNFAERAQTMRDEASDLVDLLEATARVPAPASEHLVLELLAILEPDASNALEYASDRVLALTSYVADLAETYDVGGGSDEAAAQALADLQAITEPRQLDADVFPVSAYESARAALCGLLGAVRSKAGEGVLRRRPRKEWEVQVLLMLSRNRELNNRQLARAVGVDPSQLSRGDLPERLAAIRQGEPPPRGYIEDDGDVVAADRIPRRSAIRKRNPES